MKLKQFATDLVLHLGIASILTLAPCLSSAGGAQTAPSQNANVVVDRYLRVVNEGDQADGASVSESHKARRPRPYRRDSAVHVR